ncbi:MAG: cytochrome c3 family protein [Chloroflexota bacterium]|nr:MAG: cytochrome c3 family protein [Chloroflexota bacterium]
MKSLGKVLLIVTLLALGMEISLDAAQVAAADFSLGDWFGQLLSSRSSDAMSDGDPQSDCQMCHADSDLVGEFFDGTTLSLFVDGDEYIDSVHGQAGLGCSACHIDITAYPHHQQQISCVECHEELTGAQVVDPHQVHVKLGYDNARDMSVALNDVCRECHELEHEAAQDSLHAEVMDFGNLDAPMCIDCHGSHNITPPAKPRAKISLTCANCHRSVFSTYRVSVHGAALEEDSNPDVPTCVDCHGAHSVSGPHDVAFRNESIVICGDCHDDEDLMAKYDISTEVFETYLDDYHGRTVELFRGRGQERLATQAVCYDCHGIHNIRSHEDPQSSVYPDNLQHTCSHCHEDADIRFPEAWLSHYIPSWDQTPVLHMVNILYQVLIVGTIGGMVAYIGLDFGKRLSEKRKAGEEHFLDEEESSDL